MEAERVRVGLNLLGNVVLFCDKCQETFEQSVQAHSLKEINDMAEAHKCPVADGG